MIQELNIQPEMMRIATVGVPNTIRRLAAHRLQSELVVGYSTLNTITSLLIANQMLSTNFCLKCSVYTPQIRNYGQQ